MYPGRFTKGQRSGQLSLETFYTPMEGHTCWCQQHLAKMICMKNAISSNPYIDQKAHFSRRTWFKQGFLWTHGNKKTMCEHGLAKDTMALIGAHDHF